MKNKDIFELFELIKQPAPSGKNNIFINQLKTILKNIKGVHIEIDKYNNIVATKGDAALYPAFACHTDEVHNVETRRLVMNNDLIYAVNQYDEQIGMGADDKAGIVLCIMLLNKLDNVKCFFFANEEIGGLGATAININYFDDCIFLIELDRKGSNDAIYNSGGVELCSEDFIINANGYEKNKHGIFTDVNILKERGVNISMLNISVGYYYAHTSLEYQNITELINCYNYCLLYIDKYKERQIHEHTTNKYLYDSYYDDYNDYNLNDIQQANCNYNHIDKECFFEYIVENYPYLVDDFINEKNNFYNI